MGGYVKFRHAQQIWWSNHQGSDRERSLILEFRFMIINIKFAFTYHGFVKEMIQFSVVFSKWLNQGNVNNTSFGF